MKLSWKEILRPTAVLFVICVAVAAALAGTNLLTEERIAQQAVATAEESRKVVLPGAEEFQAQEDGAYYTGSAGGQLVGYVFETEASGYGGKVKVMTGIDAEGAITGVVILSPDAGRGPNPGHDRRHRHLHRGDQRRQPGRCAVQHRERGRVRWHRRKRDCSRSLPKASSRRTRCCGWCWAAAPRWP